MAQGVRDSFLPVVCALTMQRGVGSPGFIV